MLFAKIFSLFQAYRRLDANVVNDNLNEIEDDPSVSANIRVIFAQVCKYLAMNVSVRTTPVLAGREKRTQLAFIFE